jgi:hypothetical protein
MNTNLFQFVYQSVKLSWGYIHAGIFRKYVLYTRRSRFRCFSMLRFLLRLLIRSGRAGRGKPLTRVSNVESSVGFLYVPV